MALSKFNHVKIIGVKTVLPEHFIDIDNELQFFDGSIKKLNRAKKMMGYGRRYIADPDTTVTDLAVDAAQKLMSSLNILSEKIELLVFVNQKPDYPEPCDACIAHGLLQLNKSCAALNINMGCSGYIYALWTAHAMIASGAVKNCLILAGDLCARTTDQTNRKLAPVFGDSASATFLAYTDEERPATFIVGCDGSGWDKIIHPIGGTRIPWGPEMDNLVVEDAAGNKWTPVQGIMKGEEIFNFTMEVAPALLKKTIQAAEWKIEEIDLFAIHQANAQILKNIIEKSHIPASKTPVHVFSKYANHSTNSVVTVLCDQAKEAELSRIIFCAFGVGLSWGSAAVNIKGLYNGGFSSYVSPQKKPDRSSQIEYWAKHFKGE